MKYDHVVWDWNGTLVDDAQLCVDILNELLRHFNKTSINLSFYRQNFLFPVSHFYKKLGLPFEGDLYEALSKKFITRYRILQKQIKLQPNAKKTLEQLRLMNVEQSILSAGNLNDLSNFISHHKLSEFFKIISGVDNIYASGKKELAKNHLKKITKRKCKVLMIGDTVHDLEVAHYLKIDHVLFAQGHNSANLLKSNSNFVINDLKNLCVLLD